ncbi:diaminobutyrate acetyltransferase [Cohnella rhizosphaerae]|uniref:L-2,4-diaminobutyric acid acetyltransferase n=1 Tax=Cohnella rhizosphaerae TaxID=1457232 RepID=A0A9X4QSB6_9BACL|nr:diaminobutyrate acetyltransferase [Cohnella rhizosphaerae]MDG0809129.1 diaminobutyrate acetyltransferase [Cohnella rhizosphaerae]
MQETIVLRQPQASDGAGAWRLVRRAGRLDVNSAYGYLMLCDMFRATCVIAESEGTPIGFVSAFVKPENRDTLFVWQVAVDPEHRGKGLGAAMLSELIQRAYSEPIRYMEATVSESNAASRRMFERFAASMGSPCGYAEGGYPAELFPGSGHDGEPLLRIGPLRGRET